MRHRYSLTALCALLAAAGNAEARDVDAALGMPAPWRACFAGREQAFEITAFSREEREARLEWAFEVGERALQRGEENLLFQAGSQERRSIAVQLPELKQGVALEARLSFALRDAKTGESLADWQKTLWLFPDNPFAGMTNWLAGLNITLFDPENTTAPCLEQCGVPFRPAPNLDALSEIREGAVIVGQGVSFRRWRGLWETMVGLAARGVAVICLAPAEGAFPLAAAELYGRWPPSEMDLRQTAVIAELDKRLDAFAWPPDFKISASELVIKPGRGAVTAEVVEPGANGWTWLLMKFGSPGARLMVCCFDIAGKWDATPSARYLLRAMLERMQQKQQ